MKTILFIIGITVIAFGCNQTGTQTTSTEPGVHKVVALEKINTSQYTYILANENGVEKWLAIPLSEIKIGETYYYTNELQMTNFVSKELGKTFESVYFLEKLSTEPISAKDKNTALKNMNPQPMQINNPHVGNTTVAPEKVNVKIEHKDGIISIANLNAKKENFAGKKISIKGKVTKFSPEIMGKNWIHIQDGSEYKGIFELTVTSQKLVKVGDIITAEGIVSVNKNFGAGYHYDVILEDAILK